MPLSIVPTPIGNPGDFTLRAIECLKQADIIIVEEFKESSRNLRSLGISNKTLEQLNEHSTEEDLKRLLNLCHNYNVALVSDSGTPGFCDPGTDLIKLCRNQSVPTQFLPGASCLMTLLSATSVKMSEFYFRGFLPAENQARKQELQKLSSFSVPIVLMDTPYRLKKTLTELAAEFPKNSILLGLNLTQSNEFICEDLPGNVLAKLPFDKGEFILILYPKLGR